MCRCRIRHDQIELARQILDIMDDKREALAVFGQQFGVAQNPGRALFGEIAGCLPPGGAQQIERFPVGADRVGGAIEHDEADDLPAMRQGHGQPRLARKRTANYPSAVSRRRSWIQPPSRKPRTNGSSIGTLPVTRKRLASTPPSDNSRRRGSMTTAPRPGCRRTRPTARMILTESSSPSFGSETSSMNFSHSTR